jgi:tetratricopeptide (TPR) repeat protein
VTTPRVPLASADSCLSAAWSRFDEGYLQDAVQMARQSLEMAPEGRPHALAALGWFLLSAGSVDEAQDILVSSLGRYPEHAPLYWYLGLVHMQAQRLEEATQALSAAVTFDPNLDEAAVSLAWILGDMGRFEEAERFTRQALSIKLRPERVAQLGWLLLQQQKWNEAILQLNEAVLLQPHNPETRCHLASALQHLDKKEEAIRVLGEGFLITPASIQLLQQHIRLLQDLHRNEEAQKSLGRLLALAPEDVTSSILAAVVLESAGDLQAASEHAERAVRRAEKSAQAWCALAQVRASQDRWEEARQALHTALAVEPQDAHGAYRQLGWVCIALNQYPEAIAAFTSAIGSSAHDAGSWYGLAEAQRVAGRYVDAMTAVASALNLRSNWLEAWVLQGRILIDQGPDFEDQSVEHLTKALSLWPKSVETRCLLATALQCVDRDTEALTLLTDGLLMVPDSTQLLQQQIHHYLKLNLHVKAHVACRRLFKRRPQDGMSWYLLSLIWTQRKRPGVALRVLARARKLEPALPELWQQTGWLALATGDLRTAQAAAKNLLVIAPEAVTSDILAALVFESCGDLQTASEHAERAIVHPSQSAQAWQALAQVRARQLRLNEATAALHTSLTLDPKHKDTSYRQLGWVCIADHRFKDAILAFTAAVEYNADDPQSWYGLAEANRAEGKRMDALKAIKRTLTLREDGNDQRLRGRIIHEQVYDLIRRNLHSLDAAPQMSPMPFPNPVTVPAEYEYVLCSLSTKSHIHLLKTLAMSARRHFTGDIYLLVVDSDDASVVPEGTTFVHRDDVIKPDVWEEMVTRYNVLELCCALKAHLMRYLAKSVGCPIVYLDADTYLLAPLNPLLPKEPNFSVALTPHLLNPLSGERHADEIRMLAVGAYNGGMLATGMHPDGIRFLDWWLARVTQYAYDSQEQGIFTDQKWLDLVPSFFRNVYISRAIGLNVGHWRVCSEHDFSEDPNGRLQFCGEQVTLMHMSGFKPDKPDLLAVNLRPPVIQDSALSRFLRRYANELIKNQQFTK